MRPLSAATARPACWLLASASVAALTCWSGAAVAECNGSPGVSIQASLGETCFAGGTFNSTDVIAGQATGGGSVLTNLGEGFSSFSFSTSGNNTPAVQADTGGLVTLTVMPPSTVGTVTTTGVGGIGLLATGAGSSITATGVAVATSGNFDPSTTSASNGLVAVEERPPRFPAAPSTPPATRHTRWSPTAVASCRSMEPRLAQRVMVRAAWGSTVLDRRSTRPG